MTTPQNRQLSDDELDLLSAYIDNQLAAAERGALEQRLGREPALRAALDELRATVALLHELAPLPPPRSFALDPALFAPRRSPLFSLLRLGAILASVLLALTFGVEFAGNAGTPVSAPIAGAPAAAAPTAAPAAALQSQRSALAVTSAPAAAEPAPLAAQAPTTAPAAAGAAPAAEVTAAPAAEVPAATAAPAPTVAAAAEATAAPAAEATAAPAAPEAQAGMQAAPTPSVKATKPSIESADTSATSAPAAQPPPALPPASGYSAPPTEAPPAGGIVQPQPALSPAPAAAIRPIRLVQIGLAGLALLLGLGALWVRRRGR